MHPLSCVSLLALALPISAQNNTSTLPNVTSTPSSMSIYEVTDQSAPFRLRLSSSNQSLDGLFLSALHEGAALEALGLYPSRFGEEDSSKFGLNTTRLVCSFNTGTTLPCQTFTQTDAANATSRIGIPGVLNWNLTFGSQNGSSYVNQGVRLSPRGVSSNMNFAAVGYMEYGEGAAPVAFDNNGYMNLQDTVNQPEQRAPRGDEKAYYRWYICFNTWYTWYGWDHLIWVSGAEKPDYPYCDKVNVQRIWA